MKERVQRGQQADRQTDRHSEGSTHAETALATGRAILIAQRADDLIVGVGCDREGGGEVGALWRHGQS